MSVSSKQAVLGINSHQCIQRPICFVSKVNTVKASRTWEAVPTDLSILVRDVNLTQVLNASRSYRIPKKLVRLVELTMKDSDAKITIGVSKSFNVLQGVSQGDGLSAVLFNLALHKY
jgi:hypothetical protein